MRGEEREVWRQWVTALRGERGRGAAHGGGREKDGAVGDETRKSWLCDYGGGRDFRRWAM